jgi:uncharacterized protein YacL
MSQSFAVIAMGRERQVTIGSGTMIVINSRRQYVEE